MNAVIGAISGLLVKMLLMSAALVACLYGSGRVGNYYVRRNPQWTERRKGLAYAWPLLASLVLFVFFVAVIARYA